MFRNINNIVKIGVTSLAFLLASPVSAAQDGWYANINGGIAKTPKTNNVETKAGPRISAAVGNKMGDFRVEGEVGYLSSKHKDIKSGTKTLKAKTTATTFMVNAFYDFDVADFTPYVGVGLGAAKLKGTTETAMTGQTTKRSASETKFAGQAIAGVRFDVADNLAVNADYRYLRTAKAKGGSAFQSHSANLGLTYYFG